MNPHEAYKEADVLELIEELKKVSEGKIKKFISNCWIITIQTFGPSCFAG